VNSDPHGALLINEGTYKKLFAPVLTLWFTCASQDASNTLGPFLHSAYEAHARERRRGGTAEGARRPRPMNPPRAVQQADGSRGERSHARKAVPGQLPVGVPAQFSVWT
jgi:hypothetical protein